MSTLTIVLCVLGYVFLGMITVKIVSKTSLAEEYDSNAGAVGYVTAIWPLILVVAFFILLGFLTKKVGRID